MEERKEIQYMHNQENQEKNLDIGTGKEKKTYVSILREFPEIKEDLNL